MVDIALESIVPTALDATDKAIVRRGATDPYTIQTVALGDASTASQAFLLARANHTGTQAASTVSNFNEAAQDAVGAMTGVSLIYDDTGATLQRAALTGAITSAQNSNATVLGSFTKAELDTAVSDGNVAYVGDAPTAHTHLLAAGATDVTVTAANLNILDDGVNTALHFHDADRARGVHTGTQLASTISDFSAAADARISAASINALSDVIITAPSTGQVVKYNGTNWINDTDATGGGGVSDGDKGDITVTASGATWTIDAGVVTLAKQADVATGTVFYRKTAAAGAPEVQTLATLKTDLGLTGTNSGDQTITLTGNVTGTGTGSFATTIANDAVTFAKFQNSSVASVLLGRGSLAGAGDFEEITLGAGLTMTAMVLSSTGGYTDEQAQDAVGLMVDASLTYVDATPLLQRAALTGDITAAAGSNATTLATVNANVGSFGLAASVAQFTVNAKGLITAAVNVAISIASTAISDSTAAGRAFLTAATAAAQTALLDPFTSALKGLVPASGGGTTNFLRADGTWAAPGGGGGVSDGDKGDITVTATGATWRVDPNIKYGLPIVLADGAFNL